MAFCFIERHVNVPGTMWCECGSLVAGTPIDGYNVISYLGHGTSSDVYLAEQPALNNRKVVIKIAHRSWNQADIDNFRREAALLASLSHPYIMPIYAYGGIIERQPAKPVILRSTQDDTSRVFSYSPYLVLPYAEQGSLEDTFMRSGKRPWPLMRVVSMAQEIADALDYAHSRGVLHRDVKPANLLSMGSHVLLSDFSVASLIDVEVSHVNAPLAGSPAYMAPEVWRHSPGRYSDQYALAVTCFRLLAGDYPWGKMNEGNVQEWLHLHCHVPPRSLQAYRPNLPGAVDLVLQMGMAKDPHERYEDVQAFAADLLEASEDRTQTLDRPELVGAIHHAPTPLPLDVQTAGKEWQSAIAREAILPTNANITGLEVSQWAETRFPTRLYPPPAPAVEEDDPITVAIESFTEDTQENVGVPAARSGAQILSGAKDDKSREAVILAGTKEDVSRKALLTGTKEDASRKPVILSRAKDPSPGSSPMYLPNSEAESQPGEQVEQRDIETPSALDTINRSPTRRWLWGALVLNGLIVVLLATEVYWQWKTIMPAINLLLALWPSILVGPLLARWFRSIRLTTLSWSVFWGVFFGMANVLMSGLVCYIWVALAKTIPHWGHDWQYAGDGLRIFVIQVVNLVQPALTPLLLGLWLAVLGGALLGISIYRSDRGKELQWQQ